MNTPFDVNAPSSRRQFVKNSALTAGALAMPHFIRAQQSDSPSNKINVACIGIGGKGRSDVVEVGRYANIVAFCDIDLNGSAAESIEKFPDVPRFTDYRKMFDKMASQIDAVTITVPDHSHYPAAMLAMELGKHVFVQKPLANTIWEARQLLYASRKTGVDTQMGIQGHTFEGIRLLREWLDATHWETSDVTCSARRSGPWI